MQINGGNSVGSYPKVLFHIPDVAWAQLFLRLGQLQLRDGSSQDGNWYPMATGSFTAMVLYPTLIMYIQLVHILVVWLIGGIILGTYSLIQIMQFLELIR